MNLLERATDVLNKEIDAIRFAQSQLGAEFIALVDAILDLKGRVIFAGMGKSGHVGRKLASTLASTGTPSLFLHPAEGIHGDLGMVTEKDLVILISNSGETPELLALLPSLRKIRPKLCAFTAVLDSTLAKNADWTVFAGASKEACPLGLAPTSSSTVAISIGDALAGCLLERRGFTDQDFALFHPGGSLGKRLLCQVKDVMVTVPNCPEIAETAAVSEALFQMTKYGLGACNVVGANGKLVGILTDGDIRRSLESGSEVLGKVVSELMTKNPRSIDADASLSSALEVMEQGRLRPIPVLAVIDSESHPVGMIHITQILKTK